MFWLCLKIFIARMIDVALATFVTVFSVKGKRKIATIIGFFDVIIWFVAVKSAITTNNNSFSIIISYALGYATGTFLGTTLCSNLINGKYLVQIIINKSFDKCIKTLTNNQYYFTYVNAYGSKSNKLMIFIETEKKQIANLKKNIIKIDKNAFFIINELNYIEKNSLI